MRKNIGWTLIPVAVIAVACGDSKARSTAMADDLKRDLQLASATQNIQISPDEIAPKAHQDLAVKPKADPKGTRVIRTNHPTVKASTAPTEAAEIEAEIPQVQVIASAPAPGPSETPAPEMPPLARPASLPEAPASGGAGVSGENRGTSGAGGGVGTVLGSIFGAVIRGGIVVGDDDCDPRGTAHRPPIGRGGSVTGVYGGGMGGSTNFPGRRSSPSGRPRF